MEFFQWNCENVEKNYKLITSDEWMENIEITSNSVQLFNTSVNLRVSIHVMGIIKIGEIFNRNK